MRKLGWYALRVAMAVFVLGSAGLLAANLYVQSHGVQQRIRTLLAATLQTPVSLRKTTFTPWDGLRLDGITLHEQRARRRNDGTDFLTADSFRVRLAWWPLLTRRQLIVEQVLLDRPQLTLREDAVQRPVQAPQTDVTSSDESSAELPPTVPTDEPPPARPAGTPFAKSEDKPQPPPVASLLLPLVRKLRVRHGQIASLDHDGRASWRVEDINADGSTPDPQHAQGALWFTRAGGEAPGAAISNYWTAIDYDSGAGLVARDGRGSIAGGTLTTDLRLRPEADRWSFAAIGKLRHAALDRLTQPAPGQPPLAEGQLHGSVDLRGFTDDSASLAGGGRLWLDGARLRDFPLIKIIGQVLRIADLSQLEFKQAQMNYRLEENVLHVDDLTLVSNNSQAVLRGQYLIAEDRLDFHGRLTIDRAISRQLPQFIETNFTRCGDEAPGSRYLDFDVTGTRDDPKCNLYDRLTAGPMKNLFDNLAAPRAKNSKTQRPDNAKRVRPALDGSSPKP